MEPLTSVHVALQPYLNSEWKEVERLYPVCLEPYSYYRNKSERRVFQILNCRTPCNFTYTDVELTEWGKDDAVRIPELVFRRQVEKGLLELFTPQYQD